MHQDPLREFTFDLAKQKNELQDHKQRGIPDQSRYQSRFLQILLLLSLSSRRRAIRGIPTCLRVGLPLSVTDAISNDLLLSEHR